jgi:hypothetical protein
MMGKDCDQLVFYAEDCLNCISVLRQVRQPLTGFESYVT